MRLTSLTSRMIQQDRQLPSTSRMNVEHSDSKYSPPRRRQRRPPEAAPHSLRSSRRVSKRSSSGSVMSRHMFPENMASVMRNMRCAWGLARTMNEPGTARMIPSRLCFRRVSSNGPQWPEKTEEPTGATPWRRPAVLRQQAFTQLLGMSASMGCIPTLRARFAASEGSRPSCLQLPAAVLTTVGAELRRRKPEGLPLRGFFLVITVPGGWGGM